MLVYLRLSAEPGARDSGGDSIERIKNALPADATEGAAEKDLQDSPSQTLHSSVSAAEQAVSPRNETEPSSGIGDFSRGASSDEAGKGAGKKPADTVAGGVEKAGAREPVAGLGTISDAEREKWELDLPDNKKYVSKKVAHYYNPDRSNTDRWTKRVELGEEERSFFQIDAEELSKLGDLHYLMSLSPQVLRLGIYLEDFRTGKTFTIHADEDFYAASTRKLAINGAAMYMVQSGLLDLKDVVVYLPEMDEEGGAGILQQFAEKGDAFSIETLIDYSGRYSDNIALNMLVRKMISVRGAAYYGEQLERMTGRAYVPENIYTPRQMANSVKALVAGPLEDPAFEIVVRSLEEAEYSEYATAHMPKHSFFHKYGLYYPESGVNVSNDIGMVYGEHPLIFSVMAEWSGEPPYELMHALSRFFYEIAGSSYFPE